MAYTEFYCDAATGSNLNAGTGGTNDYSTAGGNWANTTRVFTVTDGTNPSTKIAVNDFCAVYVTAGATVATFIGRVSAVQNATNGTVTFSTAFMGANPSNGTGTMTLKHGGFWKGPNAASAFPFDRAQIATAMNTSSDQVRINLKSGTSYSISSGISTAGGLSGVTVQGYSTSPGDGGKATIDGSTNAITLWTDSANGDTIIDLILVSSATSGAGSNLMLGGQGQHIIRVVSTGARNVGFGVNSANYTSFIECEAYGNNTGNNANSGGFWIQESSFCRLFRCYSHDNSGSGSNGFYLTTTNNNGFFALQCIADSNGANGFNVASPNFGTFIFENCDLYNNTSDGIKLPSGTAGQVHWIENCNFIKNGGKGINNTATTGQWVRGFVYNCGYGSGTQANTGGDATLGALVESGKVTYASGVTPWVAPTTGNFTVNLAAAMNAGRAHWEENDGTNAGTVSYPDIGAAQHYDTQKGFAYSG